MHSMEISYSGAVEIMSDLILSMEVTTPVTVPEPQLENAVAHDVFNLRSSFVGDDGAWTHSIVVGQ